MQKEDLSDYSPTPLPPMNNFISTAYLKSQRFRPSSQAAPPKTPSSPKRVTPPSKGKRKLKITKPHPLKRRRWTATKAKPHRPLSAYNLFFRDERHRIITWCDNECPNGKVGFSDMAKIIAPRWKTLDKKTKMAYERSAVEERVKYFNALKEWEREQQEQLVADRSSPDHHHLTTSIMNPIRCFSPGHQATTTAASMQPDVIPVPVLPDMEEPPTPPKNDMDVAMAFRKACGDDSIESLKMSPYYNVDDDEFKSFLKSLDFS